MDQNPFPALMVLCVLSLNLERVTQSHLPVTQPVRSTAHSELNRSSGGEMKRTAVMDVPSDTETEEDEEEEEEEDESEEEKRRDEVKSKLILDSKIVLF